MKGAESLADIGRGFYSRGWVLGTSGNFSAVTSRKPLRLAITSTGLDKGSLAAGQFLEIDDKANVVRGDGRPSAEALLHLAIVHGAGAGAVLHTHSVWSTVLSGSHARHGGLALEGYEMLKGLAGVQTHKHREWLPILENSQDMVELANRVHAGALGTIACGPKHMDFFCRSMGFILGEKAWRTPSGTWRFWSF